MASRRVAEFQEEWAQGAFLSENPYVAQVQSAKAVGACEVYSMFLTMNEEDINS